MGRVRTRGGGWFNLVLVYVCPDLGQLVLAVCFFGYGRVVARTEAGLLVVDGGDGSVLYLCTYAQYIGEFVLAG